MEPTPLFTFDNIRDAETILRSTAPLPINRAIWFRNALHALLRDVDRAQSPTPPAKLIAVDASEIAAATAYNRGAFTAFTFGGLLLEESADAEVPPEYRYIPNVELESIDKLIIQYLLEHRKERYILLDPHAEETTRMRDARERVWNKDAERLFNANLGRFAGFKEGNLDSILRFVKESSQTKPSDEWKEFRSQFLPKWREEMLDALWSASTGLDSIEHLIKEGKYLFLREQSFGRRSLLNFISQPEGSSLLGATFEWAKYEQFAARPDTIDNFVAIHSLIIALIRIVARTRRTQKLLDRAAERDARAFAIVHTWNSFFQEQRINARIELVTRSPALHSVLGALPENRLHVTLRHPFLIPDIYQFDAQSLAAIGGVLNRLDSVLGPYLKHERIVQGEAWTHDITKMRDARDAARSVVPLLRDILTVQQGLEQSPETLQRIYAATVSVRSTAGPRRGVAQEPSDQRTIADRLLIEKIDAVFRAIKQQLRNRSDPFSREATLTLIERNSALVNFEAARTFTESETATFRVFDFRRDLTATALDDVHAGSFSPVPFITLRCVEQGDSAFSRIAFVHSSRMIQLLAKHAPKAQERPDETQPTEWRIPVADILDGIRTALFALRRANAGDLMKPVGPTDVIFNLDATLIACLLFASKRRFDTVISLTSTILHQISGEIRRDGVRSTRSAGDVRLGLAYRELFLLRHFCERGVAVDEYIGAKSSQKTIAKHFSRAKRDLDFATLMSEDAEFALASSAGSRPDLIAPSGVKNFNDYRLKLAHLGGWTEQFLIAIDDTLKREEPRDDWFKDEPGSPRRSFGIWAAAGLVKETIVDAYVAHDQRMSNKETASHDAYKRRYLAYVEMRALQGALTIFLIFLAYRVSPDMHRFWAAHARPEPDRVFIFREWRDWFRRYSKLVEVFKFKVRADSLIDRTCFALGGIADLQVNAERRGVPDAYSKIIDTLRGDLGRIAKTSAPNAFVRTLVQALSQQVDVLMPRTQDDPAETDSNG